MSPVLERPEGVDPVWLIRNLGLGTAEQRPCPVCQEHGGFHDAAKHSAVEVPRGLVWTPGEQPLWARDGH